MIDDADTRSGSGPAGIYTLLHMHRLGWRGMAAAIAAAVAIVGSGPLVAAATITAAAIPVVPVTRCTTVFGTSDTTTPWVPTQLPVSLPRRSASRVAFYSNGFVTVLAPRGWSCAGVDAANGGRSLSVFPPGRADPLGADRPASDTAGVTVLVDYTGHGPGAQLVCSLFPRTRAAALARSIIDCPGPPPREAVERPTPDVALFRDPPGVAASGSPSGGRSAASGVAIFPQLNPEPSSVPVAKATCTLPPATSGLCSAVIADFLTRSLPGTTTVAS